MEFTHTHRSISAFGPKSISMGLQNTWLNKQTPDFSLQLTTCQFIHNPHPSSSPIASSCPHLPSPIASPHPRIQPIRDQCVVYGYPESVKLAAGETKRLMAPASDFSEHRPPPPRWLCSKSQGRAKGQSPICPSSRTRPLGCGRTSRPGRRTPGGDPRPAS